MADEKLENKNDYLVVSYFDTPAVAESAVETLKRWDKSEEAIKLGGIAVLARNEEGKLESQSFGPRLPWKGAKIGTVVGLATGILSGGLTVVGGAVIGGVAGGLGGSRFKKGAGLNDDDIRAMDASLGEGQAIVLVLCDEHEMEAVEEMLTAANGRPEHHAVEADTLEQAAAEAETAAS
jgi:uncharacterized membrane protein